MKRFWLVGALSLAALACDPNTKPTDTVRNNTYSSADEPGWTISAISVRVAVDDAGELRVRDYKTGNTPGDDFQLGVYSVAVEELWGVKPPYGDYFMAGKKGSPPKLTAPYDLSRWTRAAVTERFHEVEARIQAGDFEPDPEPSKCGFCDVNLSCPVFNQR